MKSNYWLTACGALMINALVSCNINDDVLSTNELQPTAIHANLTISYTYTDKDDPLGNIHLNFKDPIITSDQESSTKGYGVYSLNTGSCELVIAPTTIR